MQFISEIQRGKKAKAQKKVAEAGGVLADLPRPLSSCQALLLGVRELPFVRGSVGGASARECGRLTRCFVSLCSRL